MKYSKLLLVNLIVACILSFSIILPFANAGLFDNNIFKEFINMDLTAKTQAIGSFVLLTLICFLAINLFFLPIYIIRMFVGVKNVINTKYVDTKESIYTRELPEYNSAIAGELVDLKTTFQEEYIAGVIELINKGYIIEKEDSILVDKTKETEGLLKNEKYILNTCESIYSNTYLMNNYNFYKQLKEDMYDLGLYKRNTFLKELMNKVIYYLKKHTQYTAIIIYSIFTLLIISLFSIITNFFRNIIILALVYAIIIVFIKKNKLTKSGELEKEKMGKLKLFLEKEANFKDKEEKERNMWGRYAAFSVAFSVNTQMKEEIKRKIMKNF